MEAGSPIKSKRYDATPSQKKVKRQIIFGPPIIIQPSADRYEVIRTVVDHFLSYEKDLDRKRFWVWYPVEKLADGRAIHLIRPGKKFGFDFKVQVPENCGLQDGKQVQIAQILRKIAREDVKTSSKLWAILSSLYHCRGFDVDKLASRTRLVFPGVNIEALLKISKWMFIMEDVTYWSFQGRGFLYNAYRYVTTETSDERLRTVLKGIRKSKIRPPELMKCMMVIRMEWDTP